MRIDEMILKANKDGKVYMCRDGKFTYSKFAGFLSTCKIAFKGTFIDGWEEKPKRHLTVEEAEKELDCVVDTQDILKLLRSPKELPNSRKNVIAVTLEQCNDFEGNYAGYHSVSKGWVIWKPDPFCGVWKECEPLCWIDPADLIKLLPKQE